MKKAKPQSQSSETIIMENMRTEIAGRMLFPVIVIVVYSAFQLIRLGSSNNHYVVMLVGALISFFCISVYTRTISHPRAKQLLSSVSMLLSCGFVFIFACYITLYQGLWGFMELRTGFSLWLVVKALVAIYLGYQLAKTTAFISGEIRKAHEA